MASQVICVLAVIVCSGNVAVASSVRFAPTTWPIMSIIILVHRRQLVFVAHDVLGAFEELGWNVPVK